jgi:heterodisulfide reductase subunit C
MSTDRFASLRRSTRATLCVECGKCTTMCPLATEVDFSARRIVNQNPQAEMEGHGVGVGRCLTCQSCEQRCPQGVQVTDYVRGLRELVPSNRRRP